MQGLGYFISLLIALAIGYFLADIQGAQKLNRRWRAVLYRRFARAWSNKKTYHALTSLLNEQSDEAVDAFIHSLAVNSETLDVHLALGGLLRRRGELDRSVKVHQNLLARPGLPADQIHLVQFELAQDYWRSGLLDRAEALFKELADISGVERHVRQRANECLLSIYQELGEWLCAVEIADRLTVAKFSLGADHWRQMQAHFCCELAQDAWDKKDFELARHKLRRALSYDPDCARARLLEAEIALHEKDFSRALDSLNTIAKQDARFLPESIELICNEVKCEEQGVLLLENLQALSSEHSSLFLVNTIANLLQTWRGEAQAMRYLLEALNGFPELKNEVQLFRAALLLHTEKLEFEPEVQKNKILLALQNIVRRRFVHLCSHCGYTGGEMRWQCPSCKAWGSIFLESPTQIDR